MALKLDIYLEPNRIIYFGAARCVQKSISFNNFFRFGEVKQNETQEPRESGKPGFD